MLADQLRALREMAGMVGAQYSGCPPDFEDRVEAFASFVGKPLESVIQANDPRLELKFDNLASGGEVHLVHVAQQRGVHLFLGVLVYPRYSARVLHVALWPGFVLDHLLGFPLCLIYRDSAVLFVIQRSGDIVHALTHDLSLSGIR